MILPKTDGLTENRKVVVACDSFKGSLTAAEASSAVASGVLASAGGVQTVCVPVADGGEGTVEMIAGALGGKYVTVRVTGPLGRPADAQYAVVRPHGQTVESAVIELAQASGLPLLSPSERDPLTATTRGTGELIADAYSRGCRSFIIGLGGSATNDGGTGLLRALGVRFLDSEGNELPEGGVPLARLYSIDTSSAREDIMRCRFTVLCDVDNPLTGPCGASAIFGPQKGASESDVALLDRALARYGECLRDITGKDIASMSGAGAAGGTAAAFMAFFNAEMVPGIATALRLTGFDSIVSDASLIITGEGHIDAQTLSGKAPYGVLEAGMLKGVPVIALAGGVADRDRLMSAGFADVVCIVPPGMPLAEAMKKTAAERNLRHAAAMVARTFFEREEDRG